MIFIWNSLRKYVYCGKNKEILVLKIHIFDLGEFTRKTMTDPGCAHKIPVGYKCVDAKLIKLQNLDLS